MIFFFLPLTRYPGGGGSGGGRGRGGRLKEKGREERNAATEQGLSQRSSTCRGVGWEGQLKRWEGVWEATLQEGHRSSGALPTLSR